MPDWGSTLARRIAEAAAAAERRRTGHAPASVAVVLSGNTLVVTLHGALSPAEQALARSPGGAAQVQEFHRQLFAASAAALREEIWRITGVEVREAAADVEVATGTVVQAFTTGTVVQVFLLAGSLPPPTPGARAGESVSPCQGGSVMLVLTRKSHEAVVVGGSVGFERMLKVTVLEIDRGKVRLGFEVDKEVPVHRWEVWERICAGDAAGPGEVTP
jgi:carbon storage regulator CsrA